MLYLILGTKTQCVEWITGVSNDADYTSAWNNENTYITKSLIKGDITGLVGVEKAFLLWDNRVSVIPQENWLCFLVSATGTVTKTVNKIFIAGIITEKPKTYVSKDAAGNHINQLNLRATSFHKEFTRLLVEKPTMVNQPSDRIAKDIVETFCDANIVNAGTIEDAGRVQYTRFSKDRTSLSAVADIAALFDWQFKIEGVLTAAQTGCVWHFRKPVKEYTEFILNNELIEKLGPLNVVETPNASTIKNIITLPYYEEKDKAPEYFIQTTTTNEIELNSRVTLSAKPVSVETATLASDTFTDGIVSEIYLEQNINNPNPSAGHTSEDGYLYEGSENDIFGLHFIDAIAQSPVWGDIGFVSNPEKVIFEVQPKTALRAKELQINQLGNAIVCAFLDVNCVNISELFDISKIICGLEFRADGKLHSVVNGVSAEITGKTYVAGQSYTIKTRALQFETYTTVASSGATLTINQYTNSNISLQVGDICEVFVNGNDKPSKQFKVSAVGTSAPYSVTFTESLGNVADQVIVRTLPKGLVEINGGIYGEVSGKEWTSLFCTNNTIQTEVDTIKEVGFCLAFQKSLVATMKEFTAKHHPPVDVVANGIELTCSTIDDSAEKDVHCFLTSKEGKYHIEFPSDSKQYWPSGTTLKIQYKEKVLKKLNKHHPKSLKEIAEKRGNPIVAGDTLAEWFRKGGLEADEEILNSNILTPTEANTLARKVLDAYVDQDLAIELKNVNSKYYGIVEPAMILPVDLPEYQARELEVTQVVSKFAGVLDGEVIWIQQVYANKEDSIDQLIQKAGNSSKRIIDAAADDSYSMTQSHTEFETIYMKDSVAIDQGFSSVNIIDEGAEVENDLLFENIADNFCHSNILDEGADVENDLRYELLAD